MPGRRHTSPAPDTRPEPLPQTVTTGVCPRRAQVRAFGGRRFCPASSSKQAYAPVAAASLVPSVRHEAHCLYCPRSGHGLEEVSVGLMAYPDP